MSELINTYDSRATIRWQLLATVSAIALLGFAYGAGNASAADTDSDHPQVWIEVGGQYDVLAGDGQQPYAPPFLSLTPATLGSPLPAQKLPGNGFDWNGKISFEPDGSDWVFSASIRYGRSSGSGNVQKTSAPLTYNYGTLVFVAHHADYVKSRSLESETHAILDFMAGKDVGLGMFGGTSVLSAGVRIAQFGFGQKTIISADPDYVWAPSFGAANNDFFKGAAQAKRSFHGIGPAISWDASAPIVGNAQNGEITLDWGANAAVLFGRRKVDIHHQTSQYHQATPRTAILSVYHTHGTTARSRQATVPNLGGFAAISMRYANAKISFGYRADEFFGAKDGGFAAAKNYSLGFYGPFANVSVGIGG